MVVTDYSKNKIGLILGGSVSEYPEYFIIGIGSGAASASDVELENASDRQEITIASYPEAQKVTFQGDWNALQMSGIQLAEFGVLTSGAGLTGSVWSRSALTPITFDGTNSLRIEETWEVY